MLLWVSSRLIDGIQMQKSSLKLKRVGRMDVGNKQIESSIMDAELKVYEEHVIGTCLQTEKFATGLEEQMAAYIEKEDQFSALETRPCIPSTLGLHDSNVSMHNRVTSLFDHQRRNSQLSPNSHSQLPPAAAQEINNCYLDTLRASVHRLDSADSEDARHSTVESASFHKGPIGSTDRDAILAKVVKDRATSHIRAWEQSEKTKSFNRYNRKMSRITAWENARKAKAEAELRKAEEKFEKKRAQVVERKQNEMARAEREAQEMKANGEAQRGEELLRVEEMAAKYRASGKLPKQMKCLICSCSCFHWQLPCTDHP